MKPAKRANVKSYAFFEKNSLSPLANWNRQDPVSLQSNCYNYYYYYYTVVDAR